MEKVRILIVEDEIIVARDTENMLMNFGYVVLGIAGSGEKAVSLAGELWESEPGKIFGDFRNIVDCRKLENDSTRLVAKIEKWIRPQ